MNIVFCALLAIFGLSDGSKILGVFPFCAYSHYTLGFRLMKELAERGHDVTFINCYPQKEPVKNFRDISTADQLPAIMDKRIDFFTLNKMSHWAQLNWVLEEIGLLYTERTLANKEVISLLHSNETFDLVVLENFMNEAHSIFHHKLKSPVVIFSPLPIAEFSNHLVGNPAPPSYVPSFFADFDSRMTFWQRTKNTCYSILTQVFLETRMIPRQNEVLKKVIPDSPDLRTILYDANLMLSMSHVGICDPVPILPSIKSIGGFHVQKPRTLPKDIQDYLDGARNGVVLFSMGSNLKSAHFPEDKKRAILNVFSQFNQEFLWKYEADLPTKPTNVRIMDWLPQSDILAHPNVIAFIGHGGLLGTTEAIYHGVPILGLPIYWDQLKNIEDLARKDVAIRLNFEELNEDNFKEALTKIIQNTKYRQNAKLRSRIMHDQPVGALDEAIFWIEYVIRYKGAPHLRSASLDLKWYQAYLIDVILVFTSLMLGLFSLIYFILKFIFRRVYPVDRRKKEN